MLFVIFLVALTNNPLMAQAPTIPSGRELCLISENGVKSCGVPIESVKFEVLAVKIQEISPERINTLPDEIIRVLKCESGLDQSKIGKAGEIGIAQFMPSTWQMFNEIRGTNLDIYNADHQLEMIVWAFENGYQSHWVCWKLDKYL